MNKLTTGNKGEIAIYEPDNSIQLEVLMENETVWLTQAQMVILFERDQSVISKHIRNVFKEGELDKNSVYAKFAYTATDGKTYEVEHYSLDVIISVGYRIKSQRGTQFRIWANKVLKEYLMKGYAVNQRFERLEYRMFENEKKIDFFVKTALPPIAIHTFDRSHDRFLFIDNDTYHIGASLKDLGKKWFAFSKMTCRPLSKFV